MNALTPIHSAGEGLRPISDVLPSGIGGIAAAAGSAIAPRYVASGGMVKTSHSGRLQTPARAREALQGWLEDALTTRHPVLVDIDLLHIVGLIHAIREAEGTGPDAPTTIAKEAA